MNTTAGQLWGYSERVPLAMATLWKLISAIMTRQ